MSWTNTSWEPPKEPYDWRCLVCETSNSAGSLACSHCGCPDRADSKEILERQRQFKLGQAYDGTHRSPPRSRDPYRRLDGSNRLPWPKLLGYPFYALAGLYAVYKSLTEGTAVIYFSRHADGIPITQFWPLVFVAAGYLLLVTQFASQIADHFDRRDNESTYKVVSRWSIAIGFPCMLIGIGLETIRY